MRTTGPAQPAQFLLDVVDLLSELGIRYAVVGAFAAAYYGVPRATADADTVIWLEGSGNTEQDVKNHLVSKGCHVELKRGDIDDPISKALIVKDRYENRVDALVGIRGMDPQAPDRCVSASLLDSSLRIIGVEDLIAMKIFAGGLQDLEDVRGILKVSGMLLNFGLLRTLTARYSPEVTRQLDALLKEFPTGMG